ncbi:hypothetical protein F5880DRAFT_1617632 [Lentinula raphanica]|nr:hypothetical protein F5880DRAFT_1617632 [Lentinula raphanica]
MYSGSGKLSFEICAGVKLCMLLPLQLQHGGKNLAKKLNNSILQAISISTSSKTTTFSHDMHTGPLHFFKTLLKGKKKRASASEVTKKPSGDDGDGVQQTETSRQKVASAAKEEFFSAMSGAAALTLDAVQSAAALAPIPYLGEAATLAIGIWEAIQSTNDTKASLRSLASDAISLVYAVMTTCDEVLRRQKDTQKEAVEDNNEAELEAKDAEDKADDPKQPLEFSNFKTEGLNLELRQNLEVLCSTLQDIKNFTLHVASRNVFLRFLTARSDSGKVVEFQNKMKMALDLFTLQSHISLRQVTGRIETQQAQLLTALQSPTISPISLTAPTADAANVTSLTSASEALNSSSPDSAKGLDQNDGSAPARPSDAHARPTNSAFSAFPAIFSFTGATFRTGDAHVEVRHPVATVSRAEDEPKSKLEPKEQGSEPGEDENVIKEEAREPSESAANPGPGSNAQSVPGASPMPTTGGIHFTSIAGNQNTSWINDQSQRWNFGNTYPSPVSDHGAGSCIGDVRRDFRGNTVSSRASNEVLRPSLGYEPRVDDYGGVNEEDDGEDFGEAWYGIQSQRNPFTHSLPERHMTNDDWNEGPGFSPDPLMNRPNHAQQYYDENGVLAAAPSGRFQTYYDENGVPTAHSRWGRRSRRRESDWEDSAAYE